MATPALKKVLITGAGTGFGHEAAMRLAEKGFDVIAAVEIYAQVQTMKRQAKERGVTLQVEKLDLTNDGDRRKALSWGVAAGRTGPTPPLCSATPTTTSSNSRPRCQPTRSNSYWRRRPPVVRRLRQALCG